MADTCPKCGWVGVAGDKCAQCGVIVAAYSAYLEKMRRGPQPRGDTPFPVSRAPMVEVAPPEAVPVAPDPAIATAAGAIDGNRRLEFRGSGASLFGIQIVNAFLTLLTLGIFYFWGKTRVRAYVLSETELEGDRFAYHGTGKELLIGSLKAGMVFFVPVMALNILPEVLGASTAVKGGASLLLYVLAMVFIPIAMVGARRYRLSRTSWRGIRFSFRGRALEFVRLFGAGYLLTAFTAGVYYPFFITKKQAFMVSNSYFGTRRFGFDGRGHDMLGPCVAAALLFLPTLGLSYFWFAARKQRYFINHTTFEGARFRSTITGRRLSWLLASNFVVLILTLGLAWPWIFVRSIRYMFRYVSLEGPLDLAAVRQDAQAVSTTGEGLSSFLDADFGVS